MAEATKKYVAIGQNGVADSKKYHFYQDCSTVRDRGPDDFEEVSDREARLMGLKVCSVCERRLTGGPAIEALKAVIEEIDEVVDNSVTGDLAWKLLEGLKERGFYVAQRRVEKAAE